LRLIVEIACKILECYGLPVDRYRTELGAQFTNSHAVPTLVKAAMRYVHKHYHEEIHLDEVAANLHCNPDYLSRLFNRHLNMGFSEYLLRVRIDHARHLLKLGRYSAGEVGFMVGFSDQSYFGKVFKKWTGITPRRFSDPEEWSRIEKKIDYINGFKLSLIDGV
jgi:YesN/AraC family two-component response regulator